MGDNKIVALPQDNNASLMDMDSGAASEMAVRLAEMKQKLDLVQNFFKDVMVKDSDYGIIPGTDKPTLYKPGAEKLCELYGFASIVKDKKETRDFNTGYYLAEVVMQIVHRKTGLIIAEGVGEACTFESKYRYRWLYENKVPKELDKGSLVKQTFTTKDKTKEYVKYRIDNPDLIDQWNTVLKMAKKRALVDATLAATRSSGIFSQSEDEMEAWINGETGEKPVDRLQKKRDMPKSSDEKSTFEPPTNNLLTSSQHGKILGEAKRKGIDENGIKKIVEFTKKKPLEKLTKTEASAVIDFLMKSNEADLLDILRSTDMPMDGDGE